MGRRWLAGVVAGSVLIFAPTRSPAGFYDPRQPTSPLVTERGVRALPFELFRDALNDTLRIADPLMTGGLRKTFLDRRSALLGRGLGAISPTELAELGAVQHRLRNVEAALDA